MTNNDNNLEAIKAVNDLSANAIEDLNLSEGDATEIKGGAGYIKIGDIDGEARTAQTREHILLARQ